MHMTELRVTHKRKLICVVQLDNWILHPTANTEHFSQLCNQKRHVIKNNTVVSSSIYRTQLFASFNMLLWTIVYLAFKLIVLQMLSQFCKIHTIQKMGILTILIFKSEYLQRCYVFSIFTYIF